jgi:hypothetical protein
LEFGLAWSTKDVKKTEAEQARRLGPYVNLKEDDDDNDVIPSQWRSGDGQGYSSWAAKAEPPSKDDDNDGDDYDVFYRCLGMQ